jgi:hypothetical protein
VRGDELLHRAVDRLPPPEAAEHPVVPDLGLEVMEVPIVGDAGAQLVGDCRLPPAADVVAIRVACA